MTRLERWLTIAVLLFKILFRLLVCIVLLAFIVVMLWIAFSPPFKLQ